MQHLTIYDETRDPRSQFGRVNARWLSAAAVSAAQVYDVAVEDKTSFIDNVAKEQGGRSGILMLPCTFPYLFVPPIPLPPRLDHSNTGETYVVFFWRSTASTLCISGAVYKAGNRKAKKYALLFFTRQDLYFPC